MVNQQLIKEFFEEQFNDTSAFFLYKDKQLLREGKFKAYAQEQIKKANKVFWTIIICAIIGSWYGMSHLIAYGSDPTWLNLSIGLCGWLMVLAGVFYAAKEYFVVKSSMRFFLKILQTQKTE